MRVSLIAAMAAGRVIGKDNRLPWRLPEDTRRFKALTLGHPMIMGRLTFESIGERPLPGRPTVVVTRRRDYASPEVQVAHSVAEALELAAELPGADEVFIAGGAEIYREALPRADRMYLTRLEAEFPGDVRFPEVDESEWRLVAEERREPTREVPYAYAFQTYDRRRP